MMTRDEFYRFIIKTQEESEERKNTRQNFLNELSVQLFELIFLCRPDIKKYKDQLSESLKELASKYAQKTFWRFDHADSLAYSKTEITVILTVPKPTSRTESEKELKELSKEIPHKYVKYLSKIHWEDYEHQKRHENFVFDVFRKMKEILVKYYEENLMEFDGKYLRLLDGDLYHLVADEFVQKYYEIVNSLKPSRF